MMANRFGRNQKRKMQAQLLHAQEATFHAQRMTFDALNKWEAAVRRQLETETPPPGVGDPPSRDGSPEGATLQ